MSLLAGMAKFEANYKLSTKINFLVIAWERSYPNIDVKSQIQWAHCWLLENPKKDKKDYVRFLGNWMRSAQGRAAERKTNVIVHKPYKEQKPDDSEIMSGEDWSKMKGALRAPRV